MPAIVTWPRAAALLALLATSTPSLALPPVVLRHEVEARLDVEAHRLEVVDVVQLETAPAAGEPWRFLLHEALAPTEVHGPRGTRLQWEQREGWDPRHFWERPDYANLEGYEVAREISVFPPAGGFRQAPVEITLKYAGIVADSLHSPERAYGRSFEKTSGRIVAEGAYLHGDTFWVPWCGNALFEFELTVDSPESWRTISQGRLAKEEVEDGRRVTRWESPSKTESIYLIAGPYDVRETTHEVGRRSVRILSYSYANTGPEITDPYLEATGGFLDRFGELFGEYPYSKFALVENYWQTGYGMPSFTFLGDRVIRLPFILHTSYPHEILHNWWGNGVYLSAESGNWSEGLTTYCADYLAKEGRSADAARDYRRDQLLGYRDFAAEGGKDFALSRFRERDSAATQAVGYGKTLMVFHMLRRLLGDETFFGALRDFYEGHRFTRAGWRELREAFEKRSGAPLEAWFDQWVGRPGALSLRLDEIEHRASPGESQVRGTLVQEEPLFDVTVPIVIEGASGERATAEVATIEQRTSFAVDVAFTPTVVRADPGFDLFRMLHSEEVAPALSGVLGAQNVRVVLGTGVTGAVRDAMRTVAEEWAGDSTVVWIDEQEAPVTKDFDGATWFFGAGEAASDFTRSLPEAEVPQAVGTLVAAGRLDGDPQRPAAVFLPQDAEVVAAIARKIHHYSKYSYLVFEGERNVGKGSWSAGLSPLTVRLGES